MYTLELRYLTRPTACRFMNLTLAPSHYFIYDKWPWTLQTAALSDHATLDSSRGYYCCLALISVRTSRCHIHLKPTYNWRKSGVAMSTASGGMIRRYHLTDAHDRIANFKTALMKLRDKQPLEVADRTAISDGLGVNAALISSAKLNQEEHRQDIHPMQGSREEHFRKSLFDAAQVRNPQEWNPQSKDKYEEHLNSEATWSYYVEKAVEKSLSKKATPLIVELAQSLNIPLRGARRG